MSSLRLEAATGGAGTATSIDDLDLEQFEDLSGGRSTCLKKIEEPGDESAGNPSTGSKVPCQRKHKKNDIDLCLVKTDLCTVKAYTIDSYTGP